MLATSDDRLRRDIRRLGAVLGEVIRTVAGNPTFELVEEIRMLSRARRRGDSEAEVALANRARSMTIEEADHVIRAFSIFFDLANAAEERHRARVLRDRERARYPHPRKESVGDAIERLRLTGVPASEVAKLLDRLNIELVFTAHPTEAKRRSVRAKLSRLRQCLVELDNPDVLPRESEQIETRLRTELVALWQMDHLRPRRPTVMEEVHRGLSFAPVLWRVVPQETDDLRRALDHYFPDAQFTVRPFIRFGSWIGGDRDGHPHVTTEVTAETLRWLRRTAIELHLAAAEHLASSLAISNRDVPILPALNEAIAAAMTRWPVLEQRIDPISPNEPYRRWFAIIHWRLTQTLQRDLFGEEREGEYPNADVLRADVQLAADSLSSLVAGRLLGDDVRTWLDQIVAFGLHFAHLDVRQESGYYLDVLDELFAKLGLAEKFAELEEPEKQRLLTESMPLARPLTDLDLSERARETLHLFELLTRAFQAYGPECLGGHVLSMTHQPSDLLAVLWFWKQAQLAAGADPQNIPAIPLVPLFETIGDLRNSHETLDCLLAHPVYGEYARRQGTQMVMVGYSDSTKDGGYLAACWSLFQCQSRIDEVARKHGVRLVIFHGRGGSLGRGGGPAARGILSLPHHTVDGAIRMTEQGEVLAERYDDEQIAYRHLEQLSWATILVGALPSEEILPEWQEAMDWLADRAFKAYRALVEQPGFVDFFGAVTPIDEIENLAIGSRPSRRRGQRTLADLRAIPWVFAWTQSRFMLPAWYGLGTAMDEYRQSHPMGQARLAEMYQRWSFFRATMDNAELALAKADMSVAEKYTHLCEDSETRNRIWGMIQGEYEKSRRSILRISNSGELLGLTPWLQRSITVRNPYVDPLNVIQVELFRRIRSASPETPLEELAPLRELLRLTIKGIAAGMRTTG